MSESRANFTPYDIFGEEPSSSSTSEEESSPKSTEKPRKGAGTAPVKRMRLTMNQKLAAIKHLEANKMTHSQLARWMKVQFKLEKEPMEKSLSHG